MRGKSHVMSGIAVALCLATFRYGDRCATVGSLVAEPESSGPAIAHVPPPPDGAARLGSPTAYVPEAGADIPWSRVLHEVAAGAAVDFTEVALEDLPATPAILNFVTFGEVRCPTIVDLSGEATGWDALKDGTGTRCAPIVVLGLSGDGGRSMRHAGRDVPVSWFAGECLLLGARCTVVACRDEACIADTHASFRDISRVLLAPYLREFLERVLHQSAPPASIAQPGAVSGAPIVALARPRAATRR